MGESLGYSWLRHIKQCKLVQTNWKISPMWTLTNLEHAHECFAKMVQRWPKVIGNNATNASLKTFLSYAEIDVLGYSVNESGEPYYYAIDVAYHKNGMHYTGGDALNANLDKIVKKLLRSALILYGAFDTKVGEVLFLTPKLQKQDREKLHNIVQDAQKFMDEMGFGFKFDLLHDDSFATQVLEPIMSVSEKISDTSELFLRSVQLYQLCQKNICSSKVLIPAKATTTYGGTGIGRYAKGVFTQLLKTNKLDDMLISCLRRKDYCSRNIGISYAILVDLTQDSYDPVRYYKDVVADKYLITSQWVDRLDHRKKIKNWLQINGLEVEDI